MTTWVLIVLIKVANAGGPTVVPGFSSKASCEVAAEAIVERWSGFLVSTSTLCVEIR